MSSTLHIDGLLASVGAQQVKGLFAPFGNVLSVNIHKPQEASSLGFGVVEMATPEEAAIAVHRLHRSY
jgi:RNA recognition motif-containing protein